MTQRIDRRPRTARRSTSLLFLVCVAGCVAAAEDQTAVAMPRGFEQVRLGITESELQELRPEAAPFDIFGEPEQKREGAPNLYIESLTENPFFDTVDFTFVRDRLCMVKWSLISQPEDFAARRARIVRGAMRKWGDDFDRVVLDWRLDLSEEDDPGPVDPEKLLPGLHWKRGAVEVLIDYTPSAAAAAPQGGDGGAAPVLPNLVRLSIFQRSCLSSELEKFTKALRPVPEGLSPDFFQDLKAEAAGALFE